jgi:hypothetical protein
VRSARRIASSQTGKFSAASFSTRTLLPPTSGAPAAREKACSARMRSGVVTAACLRMIVSGVKGSIVLGAST